MSATPESPVAQHTTTALGFDFGDKRIGVAVGQSMTGTASALTTVAMQQQKPDWSRISQLIDEWQPDVLVVGIPLTMAGETQPMTDRARAFARKLEGRYHLPVHGVDERLSTRDARDRLHSSYNVDSEAARIILETWLSEHARNNSDDSNLSHQRNPRSE